MNLKIHFLISFLCCSAALSAQNIQTELATDSSYYYASTQKPAISDPSIREFAPSIQADGKRIFFEANVEGSRYRLYQSDKEENGQWGKSVALDDINSQVDSTDLLGGPNISFDGNTLFFFRSVGFAGNHDIFYSVRQKNGWSAPIDIGAPINTPDYEAFPSISADGSTLYFVRQNKEGTSSKELKRFSNFCTSIYRSIKDSDGKWTRPEKLPFPINQDCEKAPRIMADGKTLIFSSNRPGGSGDFDLYQSQLTVLGTWSYPEPLNFVNTPQSDQLPCISAQGDLMYYTYNDQDIYSVNIPFRLRQFMNNVLQGNVVDQDTQSGIKVDIIVTDAITSREIMRLDNNEDDGRYTLVLPVGRSFNVEFRKSGYSSYLYALDLRNEKKYRETNLDVELFKAVHLALHINDKELYEPIVAEIQINSNDQNSYSIINDPITGIMKTDLPIGSKYRIIVKSNNFMEATMEFDISGLVIYRDFEKYLELVPIKKEVMINVGDLTNNSKVRSKVLLKNKNRDEIIEISGNQMVSLRAGDRYEVEITSDAGYAFESGILDLSSGATSEVQFKLQKLEVNAKLTLKDITFESNSAQLTDMSFDELNRVIKLLKENKTLKIEIAAHTDDVGSDKYNLVLSQKRAQSVSEYLLSNNIGYDRCVTKGYGEKQPKVENITDEARAMNRRVELTIISI